MFPYHQAIEQHPGPATMDKTKGRKKAANSISMEWDFPILMHQGLNKMADILQEEFTETICWKHFFYIQISPIYSLTICYHWSR